MKKMPDKAFDLAVVDPPYGGGSQKSYAERDGLHGGTAEWEQKPRSRFGGRFDKYNISATRTGGTWAAKFSKGGIFDDFDIRHWDVAPSQEYFDELARVSKNQIIWGGKYFGLPPTRCFLVWDKINIPEDFSMAMCEYAWTSFNANAKLFKYPPMAQKQDERFHPTQKPVALYEWIFNLYAKPGDRILDTHLGSGSSRIAAYKAGLDFVGYEIDKYYFEKQEERFRQQTVDMPLF